MRILKRKRWILSTLISVAVIASFLLIPWVPQSVGAVAPIYPLINYLDDLLDVNVPAPTNNYIIYWNNTSGYWEARAEDIFVCGDLNTCNISELANVNATSPADGDFLSYSTGLGYWQDRQLAGGDMGAIVIGDLSDVNASAPNADDILFWNNTASEWQTKAESGGAFNCSGLNTCNISELANVNATAPSADDILFWNNTAGEWQNIAESTFSCADLASCDLTDLGDVNTPAPSDDDFLYWNNTASEWQSRILVVTDVPNLDTSKITTGTFIMARFPSEAKLVSITFIVDGICATITTGEKGHLEIPFNCTIQRVTMEADQSGSVVVDIWKDTYANFPPTNADSITSATPPTITTAQKSQDSTLTNWTTTISAGDILAYNVDSCTNITRVTVSLKAEKT